MRVCILNDNFYRGSGITLVVQRLVRSASLSHVDFYLAGCSRLEGRKDFVEECDMVRPERFRNFDLMSTGPGLVSAVIAFGRWLREIRCDVIHVHHRRLAVLSHLLERWTGVPVLFTGHLTFAPSAWFKYLSPRTMTGVSPSVVAYLKANTRAHAVHLVANPCTFQASAMVGTSRPSDRVLTIGRLDAVKAHATLVEAWSRLQALGIVAKLDIFGEGPLRQQLAEMIRSKDLQDQVTLMGFADDIALRLDQYSFNVLVSEREGFPNAVVETAAYGLPTLLTDVDGSRDTLPSNLALPNAIRVGDVDSLSLALCRWLSSPEEVAEDGIRFYRHLKQLCDPDVVGGQFMLLYEQLCAGVRSQSK